MSDLVYHYTPLPTLLRIVADGVVRAHPKLLFDDPFGTRVVAVTPPVVWLTLNPLGEGTTFAKARAVGYRGNGVGYLCRVAVRNSADLLELPDYSASIGVKRAAWKWVIRTARWIDIDPSVWRLCPRDIPREEWVRVEVMTAIDAEGTTWRAVGREVTGAEWRRTRHGRK